MQHDSNSHIPQMSLLQAESAVRCLRAISDESMPVSSLSDISTGGLSDRSPADLLNDLLAYGAVERCEPDMCRLTSMGKSLAAGSSAAHRQMAFLTVDAFRAAFDEFVAGGKHAACSWTAFFRISFWGATDEDGSVMLSPSRISPPSDLSSHVDLGWGDENVEVRLSVRTSQPLPLEAYDYIATAAAISKEIAEWLTLSGSTNDTTGTAHQHDGNTTAAHLP